MSLHTPLAELGMDSMMAVEIKQTLEREFEVFLTPQDIRSLNYARLQEISLKKETEEKKLEQDVIVENLSGVTMLIRSLGLEEPNKDICVPLVPRTDEKIGEIFVLPGIEGTHTIFRSLTSKLKYPTTCLQLGTARADLSSIEEMADFLMPVSNRWKEFVISRQYPTTTWRYTFSTSKKGFRVEGTSWWPDIHSGVWSPSRLPDALSPRVSRAALC